MTCDSPSLASVSHTLAARIVSGSGRRIVHGVQRRRICQARQSKLLVSWFADTSSVLTSTTQHSLYMAAVLCWDCISTLLNTERGMQSCVQSRSTQFRLFTVQSCPACTVCRCLMVKATRLLEGIHLLETGMSVMLRRCSGTMAMCGLLKCSCLKAVTSSSRYLQKHACLGRLAYLTEAIAVLHPSSSVLDLVVAHQHEIFLKWPVQMLM